MLIAKKFGLAVLSPLFIFLLFATAFDIGLVRMATHPQAVKKMISESGVYDSVVPNVLSQVKSIPTPYGDISASDPAIKKAVNASLPPGYIQENTELAIDNIYAWLNGKIAQPNFTIDFSGAKVLFANNVADSVQKRLSLLPTCSLAQSLAIVRSGSYDASSAICLPRGVSPAAVAEQIKAGIVNQKDFLKNTTITAASIKGNDGQPIFSGQLAGAPKSYQWLKKIPWILTILTVLCGLGVVFLSRSRTAGLRHIGINLLIIGLIMLLFSWGINRAVSTNITPKIKVDNAILQQDLRSLITDVAKRVDKNYQFFGGLYIVLGMAGVISAQLAFRGRGPGTPGNTEAEYQAPARRPNSRPGAPPKPKAD